MPQKRKFQDDDEEQNVKPKIVKVEPEGNAKKKEIFNCYSCL